MNTFTNKITVLRITWFLEYQMMDIILQII
jgi:hypothetical protein